MRHLFEKPEAEADKNKNELAREIVMAEMVKLQKETDEVVELMQDILREPELVDVWAGGKTPTQVFQELKETLSLMRDQMDKLEGYLWALKKASDLPPTESSDKEPPLVN